MQEQTSKHILFHGVRSGIPSKKHLGNAHGPLQVNITELLRQFIRDFQVLIFDPLDSITAIFKFQISSLHIQTPAVYPIVNNKHG